MAVSFSRPDPSSSAAVSEASFSTSRRGYDPAEVRDFLRMVAAELARLQERERFLEREVIAARQPRAVDIGDLDEDTITQLLGEETARVLTTARESASQIRAKAEESSSRLLREAQDTAAKVRELADLEASRQRQDATRESEAEIDASRQAGRQMVEEARDYREKVVADINRRREAAKVHLAQLAVGRDRIVNAFDRARLAANDVIGELTALGEDADDFAATGPSAPSTITPHRPAGLSTVDRAASARPQDIGSEPIGSDVQAADLQAVDARTADDEGPDEEAVVEAHIDRMLILDVGVALDGAPRPAEARIAEDKPGDDDADGLPLGSTGAEPGDDLSGDDGGADVQDDDHHDHHDDHDDVVNDDDGHTSRDDDDTPLAPVVELFAGALDGSDQGGRPSAEDVFARLRGVRPDDIARSATLQAAASAPPARATDSPRSADFPPVADRSSLTTAGGVPTTEPTVGIQAATDPDPAPAQPGATGDPIRADEMPVDPVDARDVALAPLAVSLARRIKRVMADEQNDVLDVLRRHDPIRSLDSMVPRQVDQAMRYAESAGDDVLGAALAGAAAMSHESESRLTRRILDDGVVEVAASAVNTEMVEPMRERLERATRDADGNNAELANHVRGIYREWKTQRVDELVTDLLCSAYTKGACAAVVPGARVIWVGDTHGPSCADLTAGVAVALSPADHVGCRCVVTRHDR